MPWAILKKAHSQKTGVSHYQETVNKINLQVGEGPSIPVMSNITFGVASLHYKQDEVGSLHTLTKHCHGNFQCKLSLFDFFQHLSVPYAYFKFSTLAKTGYKAFQSVGLLLFSGDQNRRSILFPLRLQSVHLAGGV